MKEAAAAPLMSTDEVLVRAADRTRRALERARLYGVHHREAEATILAAWEAWRVALDRGRPVVMQTGMDGLSVDGRLLLLEDEDRDGLGRLLHREGIAELCLEPSLEARGFVRFLDVVRLNLGLPEHEEENLESLLWQAGIEGLRFRAVAALMEAEAISGDAIRYMQTRAEGRGVGLARPGWKRGAEAVPERLADDVLARAVAEADRPMIAGEDGAWELEEQDLRGLLDAAEAESRAAVAEMAREQPGDQVHRVARLLVRVARAGREELDPDEAIQLLGAALDQIHRLRDTFALARLIQLLREETEATGPPRLRQALDLLLAQATQPLPLARLLSEAGPESDPAAAVELFGLLDDPAIRALIEWSFADPGARRSQWLATVVGEELAERARSWLWKEGGDPDLLIPAARLLRGLDAEADRLRRPAMLRHPASRVVEVALDWYAATGTPLSDLGLVMDLLEDRRPRIRAAARRALRGAPALELQSWFAQRVTEAGLDARSPELQKELCISAGLLLGARATRPLQLLLERRMGLFAGRKEGEVIHAAALGLLAIGTPEARALVEEGSRSWVGARAKACKLALAEHTPTPEQG